MKKAEFIKERPVLVRTEDGIFEFNSIAETINQFPDITNHDCWAIAHINSVFIDDMYHSKGPVGKIVETFENSEDAVIYAEHLNKWFAIIENYSVEY